MRRLVLTISGTFEDHQLLALVALLRSIDRHNNQSCDLCISEQGDAEIMMRALLPTELTIHRKQ